MVSAAISGAVDVGHRTCTHRRIVCPAGVLVGVALFLLVGHFIDVPHVSVVRSGMGGIDAQRLPQQVLGIVREGIDTLEEVKVAASGGESLMASSSGGEGNAFAIHADQLPFRHRHEPNNAINVATPDGGGDDMHVVLLGDSIMRYQYLDLIYRLHTCTATPTSLVPPTATTPQGNGSGCTNFRVCVDPPDALLLFLEHQNTKHSGKRKSRSRRKEGVFGEGYSDGHETGVGPNFMNFHRYTVSVFNGSMSCDCSRKRMWFPEVLGTIIEARSYRHPTRRLHISFLQVFGDRPLLARARLNTLDAATGLPPNARPVAVEDDDIFYFRNVSLLTFARDFAPAMLPRPTHFVLNIGAWAYTDEFAQKMPEVVKALRHSGSHVVWRETSQPSVRSITPDETLTFENWASRRHRHQRIDALMYDTLCSHVSAAPAAAGAGGETPSGVVGGGGGVGKDIRSSALCHYISLPLVPGAPERALLPPSMYGDHVHPLPFHYKYWNANLWPFLLSLR
jgi:hypothetical protein